MSDNLHPPKPVDGPLITWWEKPVHELVQLSVEDIPDEEKERHNMYSLLALALTSTYWNGNKRGNTGTYPWREKQRDGDRYQGGDYQGHNIVAIAIDRIGEIIDYDFNHNDVFSSSVEHAESRLIRRVFSLSQIYDNWETVNPLSTTPTSYANVLSGVTIYTSLESCSQCSGIMALGSVGRVVFLQRDPGQYSIGNILRNLTPSNARYRPPLPIPADAFGFRYFERFSAGYEMFASHVKEKPFWIPSDKSKEDFSPSITSFLCTDEAMIIFSDALEELKKLTLRYPTYRPKNADGQEMSDARSNSEVLDHVYRFFTYAKRCGNRGAPHRV